MQGNILIFILASFWIAIAVLYRRIVAFSIQLSEDNDVVRSVAKNGGDVLSKHSSLSDLSSLSLNETLTQNHIIKLNELHYQQFNAQSFDTCMAADLPSPQIPLSSTNCSDVINHRRVLLPTMIRARCSMGATFVNGRIIIFGGYDRGECLKSVEELEVAFEEKWCPLPEMLNPRGRFDSAVESGKVYAIAGSNGNNDLKSCEVYDPKLKQWSQIKSLNKARSHNGILFVLFYIYIFLNINFCYIGCTTIDGLIYCIGGSSDQVVLRHCERYDPKVDEWQFIAPLQTPRFQVRFFYL